MSPLCLSKQNVKQNRNVKSLFHFPLVTVNSSQWPQPVGFLFQYIYYYNFFIIYHQAIILVIRNIRRTFSRIQKIIMSNINLIMLQQMFHSICSNNLTGNSEIIHFRSEFVSVRLCKLIPTEQKNEKNRKILNFKVLFIY